MFVILPFMTTHAQWVSNPALNNRICQEGSNQNAPRIITDGQGGAIICWHDQRGALNSFDIYAQRIDKDGFVLWTVNGNVVSDAWNSQSKPDMATDGEGGAIIVWTDTRNDNNDIYAQRIDGSGKVLWGPDGVALSSDTTNEADPKVISDGKHGAIVTWNAGLGGFPPTSRIYAQRLGGDGALLWGAPVLVSGSLRFSNAPCITTDGSGGAYIAYAYYPRPEYDVYAQHIDSSGNVLWESKGKGVATNSGSQDSPVLVADGAGNAFLAYADWGTGAIATVYVSVLKKDGPASSTRVTSTTGGQLNPQMSMLKTGVIGCAWEDGRGGGKKHVYAQIFDTTGSKSWEADGVLVSTSTGDQLTPYVVSDGKGGVIVAWEDKSKGVLNSDIYAQRLSETGTLLWGNNGSPVCTAANGQQFPWMISDGHNGAIITWEDYRPSFSNSEIYASRILADGSFPTAPAMLTFSKKSVAFGAIDVGRTSMNTITLSNTGDEAVTISAITPSDSHFSFIPASMTIGPNANITADVKFTPTTKDALSAFIVVQSNSIFGPDTITVTGSGSASAAMETDRAALNFGNVNKGSSKTLALKITNSGNDTLTISNIASSDPKFTVTIASKVLAPGASFDDSVRFSPTAIGPASAELTLTSNAPDSPKIIPLSGAGVSMVTMSMDLADISFGDVAVGSSKDTTITISNTGTDELLITAITSGDARFTSETPLAPIAPAAMKSFTLRFAPDAVGAVSTNYIVASNALSSPDTILVDGVGVADPAISFAPPQLTFGSVELGSKEDLVLTINNNGSLNLTVTSITSTNADFSAVLGQFEVAGGGSFADTIRFMPTAVGARDGVLIIMSNAMSSPDTVVVQGTGTDVNPVHHPPATAGAFTLSQNYPNPFNPATAIEFTIPARSDVRLSVVDHLGREIAVLADGEYEAGSHTCRFDAADQVSGMYIYRLSVNGTTRARKMLLLR
jgi:hypothetical protein